MRQGTTTVEAQEGEPSTTGVMTPQPDQQADKMDQWTEKVLIIAGSIGMKIVNMDYRIGH
jgi:hypothetical protein